MTVWCRSTFRYCRMYQIFGDAWNIVSEVAQISVKFARTYIYELARHNNLRTDLIRVAQENAFVFDGVKLNGEEATNMAKRSCANAWTVQDDYAALEWAAINVTNESGVPDSRWNGKEVSSYCQQKIAENRVYLLQHYDSVKMWICDNVSSDCQMDDLPDFN